MVVGYGMLFKETLGMGAAEMIIVTGERMWERAHTHSQVDGTCSFSDFDNDHQQALFNTIGRAN